MNGNRRRILSITIALIVGSLAFTAAVSLKRAVSDQHAFKTINDVSTLNETRVYDIIKVTSINDIQNALRLAKENNLQISLAGARHSMGGQAFFKDALVLDMTEFNTIVSLDETNKTITVQSGATWHDIQIFLNKKKIMPLRLCNQVTSLPLAAHYQ